MASEDTRRGWIDKPAFVTITLVNGTSVRGRFVGFSDPSRADIYAAFHAIDVEGAHTYIPWAAVAHLQTWPDGTQSVA